MFIHWLRENNYASAVLLAVRLYLGWQWFIHGWEKLRGGFDAKGFLTSAVTKPVVDKATNELIYPNFTWFVNRRGPASSINSKKLPSTITSRDWRAAFLFSEYRALRRSLHR